MAKIVNEATMNPADGLSNLRERREFAKDTSTTNCVILESNILRKVWTRILGIALFYSGTILPYEICFLENGLPHELLIAGFWKGLRISIDILFWFDLFINFFLSYRDIDDVEIVSLRKIGWKYLKTLFVLNLIACLPWTTMFTTSSASSTTFTKILRLSPLLRLVRLPQALRSMLSGSNSVAVARFAANLTGVRVFKSVVGLLWCVHLFACGWYLCASLQEEIDHTWIAARKLPGGIQLLDVGPELHWAHSMYSIMLGVFQGDMFAGTFGEVVYASFTMIVGAVINGIIIGEVIQVITTVDRRSPLIAAKESLVESFAAHTKLDRGTRDELKSWIRTNAQSWISIDYDRNEMRELFTHAHMPPSLIQRLEFFVFHGQLRSNSFFTKPVASFRCPFGPKLQLLLALAARNVSFIRGELIYQVQDTAVDMFLVLSGTFAFVALPTKDGILQRLPPIEAYKLNSILYPYMLFGFRSYFGDSELFTQCLRQASTRCESRDGEVLQVRDEELRGLSVQFPEFGHAWRSRARCREWFRVQKLSRVTKAMSFESLAAVIIQNFYRSRSATVPIEARKARQRPWHVS